MKGLNLSLSIIYQSSFVEDPTSLVAFCDVNNKYFNTQSPAKLPLQFSVKNYIQNI